MEVTTRILTVCISFGSVSGSCARYETVPYKDKKDCYEAIGVLKIPDKSYAICKPVKGN